MCTYIREREEIRIYLLMFRVYAAACMAIECSSTNRVLYTGCGRPQWIFKIVVSHHVLRYSVRRLRAEVVNCAWFCDADTRTCMQVYLSIRHTSMTLTGSHSVGHVIQATHRRRFNISTTSLCVHVCVWVCVWSGTLALYITAFPVFTCPAYTLTAAAAAIVL